LVLGGFIIFLLKSPKLLLALFVIAKLFAELRLQGIRPFQFSKPAT
jgi:hypothetical protein